jgi:hypothetical protein
MAEIKFPVPSDTPTPVPTPTETVITPAVDNPAPVIEPTPVLEPTYTPDPTPSGDVEIDGVVYQLDEHGNAKDATGNVFMDKAALDALAEGGGADDVAGINDITKLVNIQPVDDTGAAIIYENTVDGIAQYINDVRTITRNEERSSAEQNFFNENPDLYEVYLHKLNTGSIDGFNNRVDWSTVAVDTASEEAVMNMIVANEVRKGTSKDRAEYFAKLIKADGKLKEQATFAQQELIASDSEYEQGALAIKQQQETDRINNENAYWDNVEASINSGKLEIGKVTYKLPQVYRIKTNDGKIVTANNQDFLNYMTVPRTYTVEGQQYNITGNQLDTYLEGQNKTHQDDVFDALKRFVRYDTSQFIQEQVKQEEKKRMILSTKGGSKRGQDVGSGGTKTLKLPIK